MNKICTSIEQSKKLIELGIDRTTSDMYYWCGSDLRIGGYRAQDEELDIPSWTLSALFKILPIFTEPTAFSIDVSVPSVTKTDNGWLLKYNGDFTLYINNGKDTEAPVEFLADNPIDAVFEMVCWLKENGKI